MIKISTKKALYFVKKQQNCLLGIYDHSESSILVTSQSNDKDRYTVIVSNVFISRKLLSYHVVTIHIFYISFIYKMSKRNFVDMAILAAYILESSVEDNQDYKVRKRCVWRRNWLKLREKEGFCAKEPHIFQNVVRMSADQFDQLLELVEPHISKSDTKMRNRISASDRLVLTLRYLATGENFRSLQYLFRISHSTISLIIPEVLDAIYKVLVIDFVKLRRLDTIE